MNGPTRRVYRLLFVGAVLYVTYGSLQPLSFASRSWTEIVPLLHAAAAGWLVIGSHADFVANVLLMVPVGFLAAGSFLHRRVTTGWMIRAALSLTAFSVVLELGQLFVPPRIVSLNDVCAQVIGGLIGIATWLRVGPDVTRRLQAFFGPRERLRPVDWLLVGYAVLFAVMELFPIDFTINLAHLSRKYHEGLMGLVDPAADGAFLPVLRDGAGTIGLTAPLGVAAAVLWRRPSETRRVAVSLCLGVAAVGLIEAAKVFVESRSVYAVDVLPGLFGIASGVWAAKWLERRSASVVVGGREPRPAGEQNI